MLTSTRIRTEISSVIGMVYKRNGARDFVAVFMNTVSMEILFFDGFSSKLIVGNDIVY